MKWIDLHLIARITAANRRYVLALHIEALPEGRHPFPAIKQEFSLP